MRLTSKSAPESKYRNKSIDSEKPILECMLIVVKYLLTLIPRNRVSLNEKTSWSFTSLKWRIINVIKKLNWNFELAFPPDCLLKMNTLLSI